MRYFLLLTIIMGIGLNALSNSQHQKVNFDEKPNDWLIADFIKKWTNNKSYTLEIIDAMPEKDYDFIPAEGMKSFHEQVAHVLNGFNYQLGKTGEIDLPKVDESSKKTVLKSATKIFDEILNYIKSADSDMLPNTTEMWYGESTKNRILNLMDNHLSHHRGQLVVYLRLKGIKPPKYIGW